MPNASPCGSRVCRSCVWWDTDARRVTLSAPCILTHAIRRPSETCDQWATHQGAHALEPLLWRLWT